jgi:uncharacterized membrane protein YidH (DUF202 family)
MKRTIGIVLIIVGLVVAVFAFTRHDDEKTLVNIGDIEIKQQDKSPSDNTAIYYVVAAICVIAGGVMVSGKKQ